MTETLHKRYVIIVGGGNGVRMNSPVPKQFMKLDGKPVIMHSINKFLEDRPFILKLFLVLPEDHIKFWEAIVRRIRFPQTG